MANFNNSPCIILNTGIANTTCNISNTESQGTSAVYIIVPNVLNILYYLIAVLGLLVNIFTVTIIGLYKPMRKYLTNILIANQSLIDATTSFLLLISTRYQNDLVPRKQGNLADEVLCRVWFTQAPMYSMLVSSTYGIVAVTVERYLAVVHPLWHKAKLTRRMIAIMILSVWLIGPAYYYPLAITTSGLNSQGICTIFVLYPNLASQYFTNTFGFVFEYLFPITCLVILYILMISAMRSKKTTPTVVGMSTIEIDKEDDNQRVAMTSGVSGHQRRKDFSCRKSSLCKPEEKSEQVVQQLSCEVENEAVNRAAHEITTRSFESSVSGILATPSTNLTLSTNIVTVELTEMSGSYDRVNQSTTGSRNIYTISKAQMQARIFKKVEKKMASTTRARKNLIKTLIIIGFGVLVCWSWSQIYFFMFHIGYTQVDFTGIFFNFCVIMMFVSCCINPIIYALQYTHFQRGIKAVMCGNKKIFTTN